MGVFYVDQKRTAKQIAGELQGQLKKWQSNRAPKGASSECDDDMYELEVFQGRTNAIEGVYSGVRQKTSDEDHY